MGAFLRIDARRAIQVIYAYIQSVCKDHAAQGVVIGLSGGIDSTVLGGLAVGALGGQNVHTFYLYDQHSDKKLKANAKMVADWLGLELKMRSIEAAMRERGVYQNLGMRLTSVSAIYNRLLHSLYRWVYGENPYHSLLRSMSSNGLDEPIQEGLSRKMEILRNPARSFEVRHRYRREVLEDLAWENHWLPLGAANRTEWLVGWFVPGGIDDLPIQPIKGLYKTQVRQIGQHLGAPRSILEQAPSPDMMLGITDELALGVQYWKIDLILDYLEGGLLEEEVRNAGCSLGEIRLVSEMRELSRMRRSSAGEPPPIEGTRDGGFRLDHKPT